MRMRITSLFETRFKNIIFLTPIVISLVILVIRVFIHDWIKTYSVLIQEDGPVEYSTVIVYLAAFVVSVLILKSLKNEKKFFVLYLVFSIGFILVAMEEISWGQRIIGFDNPEWFPENIQEETSLHNLEALIQYRHGSMMAVSIFGTISWIVFLKIQKNLKLFSEKTFKTILRIVVPSKYLVGYFIPVFIVFFIFDLPRSKFLDINYRISYILFESEPFELLLSIGVFLFLLDSYFKQKNFIDLFSKE